MTMTKWEYEWDVIREDPQEVLDFYGKQGWELVSVDGHSAYFKRPLDEE